MTKTTEVTEAAAVTQATAFTHTPHCYQAFGLSIQSDILLPELPELQRNTLSDEADIHIVLSTEDSQVHTPLLESQHFSINHQAAQLKGDGFSLTVTQGKHITVHCHQLEQHLALIRLRILGAGLGLLLQQRGYLVLHGATLVGDKGAAVMMGNSGDGKSTLCAQLVQQGYRSLGDDKCVIRFEDETPYALPSTPFIKLGSPYIESLGFSPQQTRPISASHNKVYVDLGAAFEREATPLVSAIVLGKAEKAHLSSFTPMQAFNTFIQHSYRKQKLIGGGLHKAHFAQCQKMAEQLTMYQYLRPLSGQGIHPPHSAFLTHIKEVIGHGQ